MFINYKKNQDVASIKIAGKLIEKTYTLLSKEEIGAADMKTYATELALLKVDNNHIHTLKTGTLNTFAKDLQKSLLDADKELIASVKQRKASKT